MSRLPNDPTTTVPRTVRYRTKSRVHFGSDRARGDGTDLTWIAPIAPAQAGTFGGGR